MFLILIQQLMMDYIIDRGQTYNTYNELKDFVIKVLNARLA